MAIIHFNSLDMVYFSCFIIFIMTDLNSLFIKFNIWTPSGSVAIYCLFPQCMGHTFLLRYEFYFIFFRGKLDILHL